MRQLAFELQPPPEPSFDNFVVGENRELVSSLTRSIAQGEGGSFYLWGQAGSGKSHLIKACLARCGSSLWMPIVDLARAPEEITPRSMILFDDIHRLNDADQVKFFNYFNAARDANALLVATGDQPISNLAIRQDVVTRLSWGLVYQVTALSDSHKRVALSDYTVSRGFSMPSDVIAFILNHYSREMSYLMALIDGLERYSLESKRPITIPLVKSFLGLND